MVERWQPLTVTKGDLGRLRLRIKPPGGRIQDVTFFRGVPAEIVSFSSTDPFGDATAQIRFPQLSPLDDFGSGELRWLKDWSDVDIVYVDDANVRHVIWEGLVTSIEIDGGADDSSVTLTCIGALYQIDFYVAQPKYYPRPLRHEDLIKVQMQPGHRTHLRTGNFKHTFPSWWTVKDQNQNVTGYTTRFSGDWGRCLTGFVQDLLAVMQYEDGSQWTLLKDVGRVPHLQLRDTHTIHWTASVMSPGVEVGLTRDLSQVINVVYGEGIDSGGTTWRNAVIRGHGEKTDYHPLSYDSQVHPHKRNPDFSNDLLRIETHINFGEGYDFETGVDIANRRIQREREPGWAGTVTLSLDPEEGSRFLMKAGQNILLKHFRGTGEDGILFHISECEIDPLGGSVTLKVDTRFRDLLTLEEALMRNNDAKTPSRLLRINRKSQVFDDTKIPWDYSVGSGFIPTKAHTLPWGTEKPLYPWVSWTKKYPPKKHQYAYVAVDATNKDVKKRWAFTTIYAASKGYIRMSEFVAVNENGDPVNVPFHVSIYTGASTSYEVMPRDPVTGERHPFWPGAFQPVSETVEDNVPDLLAVGWGDGDQKAGYWPKLESEAAPPTGRLKEEGQWWFEHDAVISPEPILVVAFYVDNDDVPAGHTGPIYFMGRLWKAVDA